MLYTFKIVFLLVPLLIGIFTISFFIYGMLSTSSGPVVKTNVGVFQGLPATDGDYDMYLGIPYAQINMSNVFGAAIPLKRLDKVFVADNDTTICPQYEEFDETITGSLDCLRLNVYSPKFTKTKHRHSVLAFIHGRDQKSGSSRSNIYGPKYLMRHGIVLVTINYRLGPYGFLCSDAAQIGNQGLKDQILALKWIQDNIAHFGGNPKKVTIAGVGAGGESVNLHLTYGKEELFQKAIIDSGIYLKGKGEYEDSATSITDLAEELDFQGDSEKDALLYLNEQSIESVIAISVKLKLDYGPCIEKEHNDAFITSNTTLRNITRVPVLIGHSNKEILREYSQLNLERQEIRDIFYDELYKVFDLDDDELRKTVNNVHNFYIKDKKVGDNIKQGVIDLASDLHCNHPTKRMIEKYFEGNPYKVYYSVFSYVGKRNFAKNMYNISLDGATRSDVLGYLFSTLYMEEPNDADQRVVDYMTTLWTNFVKYGNPTPTETALLPMKWVPATKEKLNYLEITSTPTTNVSPFYSRMAFWDIMYKLYGNQERITNNVEPWRRDD